MIQTKLFSDLHLAKFRDTSAKSFFSCNQGRLKITVLKNYKETVFTYKIIFLSEILLHYSCIKFIYKIKNSRIKLREREFIYNLYNFILYIITL